MLLAATVNRSDFLSISRRDRAGAVRIIDITGEHHKASRGHDMITDRLDIFWTAVYRLNKVCIM